MTQKEEHIAESGSLKDRIMAMPHDGVLFRSVKKDFENREQMFSEILFIMTRPAAGGVEDAPYCPGSQYEALVSWFIGISF